MTIRVEASPYQYGKRHQDTARNTGRVIQKYIGWENKERNATTRERQSTGPPVKAGRGGGGVVLRVIESGKGRKGPLYGRTLGSTRTWAQVEDGRGGGQPDGGWQAWLAKGTSLGHPAWEGSADGHWQPAGGSALKVDSFSATRRERGWKKRMQR